MTATNGNEIPEDVRTLLAEHIESFEQLEILLLVHESADAAWSSSAIAKTLNISVELTQDTLCELGDKGLVRLECAEQHELIVRSTADPSMHAAFEHLAHAYCVCPAEVVRLVSEQALKRIRIATRDRFGHGGS